MEIADIIKLLNTRGNTILRKDKITKVQSEFLEKYKDSIIVEDCGKYYLLTATKTINMTVEKLCKNETSSYELWRNGKLCYSGSVDSIAKILDISKSSIYKKLKSSTNDYFEIHGYMVKRVK